MQSLLIVSEDKKIQENYLRQLFTDSKIDIIDVYTLESEKSIGIEEIRSLQKKLFLKPIKSPSKAIAINDAQTLTIESQNALLKVLEEPPRNTIIILNASNENALLPTILSRCKIIKLKNKPRILEEKEEKEILELLSLLSSQKTGEKLKLAENLSKTKEETILKLEKIILVLRKNLLEEIGEVRENNRSIVQLFNCYTTLNKVYVTIKTTNVNSRLALENLFLSFESPIPVCQFNSKPGLES